MSADIAERIARLRRDAATHATVAPAYADDLRALLADYDEERAAREREWTKGRDAEADRDAQRTRAEAAEAEVADVTRERDTARREAALSAAERDTLRSLTDALRESDARLRAIVAGRTVAPTDDERSAHEATGGGWLLAWYGAAGVATEVAYSRGAVVDALAEAATLDGLFLALPLGSDRRPTAWPVPA